MLYSTLDEKTLNRDRDPSIEEQQCWARSTAGNQFSAVTNQ